jgi:hypothetical protein
MPNNNFISRMDSEDSSLYVALGSRVKEKFKHRLGYVYDESSVNGARILNVQWDDGSKDFVNQSSVEVLEGPKPGYVPPSKALSMNDSPPAIATAQKILTSFDERDDEDGSEEDKEKESEDPLVKYSYTPPKKVVNRQYNGETLSMEVIDDSGIAIEIAAVNMLNANAPMSADR